MGAFSSTGRAATLPAIGIIPWGASPIKLLRNLRDALVLLPTSAHFLPSPRLVQAAPARGSLIQSATQFYGEKS